MSLDMLPMAEIERRILALDELLDELTHDYASISDEAAEAEAAWKSKHARTILTLATGEKMTVQEREAKAEFHSADEYRIYRLADARRHATREALLSARTRLDAFRTLAANVRALTTR